MSNSIILSVDDGSPPLRFSVQLIAMALSVTPHLRKLLRELNEAKAGLCRARGPALDLVPCRSRLPQHVAALERRDVTRGDEQMV